MFQELNLSENKLNNLLDEFNNDRMKLFNEIKSSSASDKIKAKKLACIDKLLSNLMVYKKILSDEKILKEKDN